LFGEILFTFYKCEKEKGINFCFSVKGDVLKGLGGGGGHPI